MAKHGEYTHIEVPFDDEERAKRFDAAVFGWTFTTLPGFEGYSMISAGPGNLTAGLGRRGVTAPPAIRNYLEVDDVDASTAVIAANGGSVQVAKTDIGNGWYAAVTDSEGNEFGIYQSKPKG